MNLTLTHARHDFPAGINRRFAGVAASCKGLSIMTAAAVRGGLLALAFAGFALALSRGVAVAAEERDFAALEAETTKVFEDRVQPFFKSYCNDCHGIYAMEGGINFSPALAVPGAASSAKAWNQAVANVKAHNMPPEDVDEQPTDEERQMFVDWVKTIKFLSPKDPGAFVIRRLTKVEYGNTLRDLFGVDPAVAAALPDEVFGEGYLNTLSPLQSEQYLSIANEVLEQILAAQDQPPTEVQKRLFGDTPASDADHRAAARKIASSLTRLAFRRPASEAELEVLLGVFDLARANELDYPASLRP